jgi:NitT/TauT family transport system substrate-binding protein
MLSLLSGGAAPRASLPIRLLFQVGLALLMAACALSPAGPSREPAAPPAAPVARAAAPAPAVAADKLAMVYNNHSIGTLPLWVAMDTGIFAKHGLDVTLEFAQGTLATQAMINGQYPVGSLSASAAVASNLQGADLRLVAALFSKSLYALVASRDISSVAQLRGKALGISKLGDSSDTSTRLILRKMGLDPETEVAILQVGNSPERYAALVAGSIQGTIADPMDVVRAQRDGFQVLADQATLGIDYVGSAMAVRGPFLREQPDQVRRFLMALVEGMHYYKAHPDEATRIASKHLESDDVEAIRTAVEVFARTIMLDKPYVTEEAMRPILDEVAFTNPAAKSMSLDLVVDNAPLQAIDRAGFIDALPR